MAKKAKKVKEEEKSFEGILIHLDGSVQWRGLSRDQAWALLKKACMYEEERVKQIIENLVKEDLIKEKQSKS